MFSTLIVIYRLADAGRMSPCTAAVPLTGYLHLAYIIPADNYKTFLNTKIRLYYLLYTLMIIPV